MCSKVPSLHGHYPTSSLLRTWPSPSRLSSTSRLRQLYDGVAPSISRWGEDGFSSCLACPCHRAIPNHPAGVLQRVGQTASYHAAFAPDEGARPPDLIFFRGHHWVHLRYGPVTHSPPERW